DEVRARARVRPSARGGVRLWPGRHDRDTPRRGNAARSGGKARCRPARRAPGPARGTRSRDRSRRAPPNDTCQPAECPTDPEWIVLLAAQLERPLPELLRPVDVVVNVERDGARSGQRCVTNLLRDRFIAERRLLEPRCCIPVLRPVEPETPERSSEAKYFHVALRFDEPHQSGTQIRQLAVEPCARFAGEIACPHLALPLVQVLGKREEVIVVRPA